MALSSSLVSLGILVGIYALLAIGLNIKFGFGGLLDIGHVTFFLIGAYSVALLVAPPPAGGISQTYILGWEMPWIFAALIAIVFAGIVGMIIALPAIRLREDYLAITVLGFSVIARRVIQNEGWLANGPRSLRGYSTPLSQYFPIPESGSESFTVFAWLGELVPIDVVVTAPIDEIIFGAIVFVLWAVAAYLIATTLNARSPTTRRDWVIHGVFAVLSLGIGYLAARWAKRGGSRPSFGPPLVGGAIAGVVATAAISVGPPALVLQVFLGVYSVLTWVLGVAVLARRYEDVHSRDALYGFGIAMGFFVTLLPLIVLGGGGGDLLSSAGLFLSIGLVSAFIYVMYYLGTNWDTYGSTASYVRVLGITALWLFALRYFVLALVTPFKQNGVVNAVDQLSQNVLWMIRYAAAGPQFGYDRFVFVLTLGLVAGVYLLAETTVKSPFGRVLKAIREDENVATALGKNTFSYKVQAMILGSAFAGLAGVMLALHRGTLTYIMFRPRVTFWVFLMVIIGGVANNRGVILGAVIFWGFRQITVDIRGYFPSDASARLAALRIALIGALLIVILYYRPEGIWGEERMAMEEVEE